MQEKLEKNPNTPQYDSRVVEYPQKSFQHVPSYFRVPNKSVVGTFLKFVG